MNQGEFINMAFNSVILVAAVVTAWAVLTGKGAKREVGPQPFLISEHEKPLTEKSHAALCGKFEGRLSRVELDVQAIKTAWDNDKKEIIDKGEERAVKIHDRIDVAIEKIGELRGEIKRIQ